VAPLLIPEKSFPSASEIYIEKPEITIGRSRHNDLYLEDPSVSRVHARIRTTAAGYFIEDNGSLHGTHVNGRPITSHRLDDNDLIDVGIYQFRFVHSQVVRADQSSPMIQQIDHLELLLEVTKLINSSLDLKDVLDHVMDAVIRVTRAERGFLMTIDSNDELVFRVARNFDRTALQTRDVAVSFSVLDRVRKTGIPVVVSDTMNAEASSPSASVVELRLRSMMCVPFMSRDRFAGLIYVDSHKQAKRFSDGDLQLFQSLASQAAVAIEKSQLHEQLQQYSASLEEQVRQRTHELVVANDGLKEAYVELQHAQAEIIQSEKVAAVGRLASGIAHEINSPLGVITSNIDTLGHLIQRVESGNVDQPMQILQGIAGSSLAASARLRRIIKAFEAFAGLDQAELKAINMNDAIETVLTLLEHEIGNRISIIKKFGAVEPMMCSPGRMHQAVMNLLLNAIQAIDGKGEIQISSEQLSGRLDITIQDTGRGMTAEELEKVFDSGFTRKGNRVRAGMGLLITQQIIRQTGGSIQIRSTPGRGTTVAVSFPIGLAEK
jgi:signal transduction histidine kinase